MSSHIPVKLRTLIRDRASLRCEYCLRHEADSTFRRQPDHIIAEKHGGLTVPDNLALACIGCNSLKGTDIASIDPQTETLEALFHPRTQAWEDHFQISDGRIEPLTPTGRVTAVLLQFNRDDLVELRQLLTSQGRYPG